MLLISTTTAAYKMAGDHRYWSSWFANAEAIQASVDDEVRFYAAIELDGRGREPFAPFIERMEQIGGVVETFSFDDGATELTTDNRLVRICTGQNFGSHYAMTQRDCTHVLFVATDAILPDHTLPKLLELESPICGLNIPTYCLDGPRIRFPLIRRDGSYFGDPAWDVRTHMQSAALLLVARKAFLKLRWRIDGDAGMSDDPCYHADAEALGFYTWVRHDFQAHHYPESVGSMESRHSEAERLYVR